MKHQWPPEVTRAMHQFFDAAPVAPSLTSVFEHRPIPSSSRPPAARLDPEERLVSMEEEIYVSLNSPTSETRNRRRLAIAAVAVVAVVGVAAIAVILNSDDDVEPAPAASTTVAPRREAGAFEGLGMGVTYTVPDGWENRFGDEVIKGDPVFGVTFVGADDNFYTNYCNSAVGPPVGPTVDDLVSAWANLPGVDATAARDVTIDGFDGKQIEFTVPDYNEDCNGMFYRCGGNSQTTKCDSLMPNDDDSARSGGWQYQLLPNMHQKIWILDVNGGRVMIMAGSFPDTSQQDRAALDEIVASIEIGRVPQTETVSFGVESANNIPVTFTAPVDWTVAKGWSAYTDSVGVLFDDISNIYTEGCQWVLLNPPPGPTVDDLVAAWANQPDLAATAAVDVTVDGYAGKQIEFTVPDYNADECKKKAGFGGVFALYDTRGLGIEHAPGYWAQGLNQHFQMWVLDVDGTRLVIGAASYPNTSPQDRAALEEALASIQIG